MASLAAPRTARMLSMSGSAGGATSVRRPRAAGFLKNGTSPRRGLIRDATHSTARLETRGFQGCVALGKAGAADSRRAKEVEGGGQEDEEEEVAGGRFNAVEQGEYDPFYQRVLTNQDLLEDPEGHRSGYLAIVGRPNAGKSTLLNALLGQKLSIVTFKAQTTRHRVVGILSNSTSQVILVDTPGFILQMRNKLEEVMMQTVRRSLKDSDAVLVLIDLTIDHKEQLAMLAPPPNAPPTAIVLNKIDTVPEEEREALVEWFRNVTSASAVLPICALTGEGLNQLKQWAESAMPEGPTLYPKDQLSEHPERFFVSEIVREKLFLQYEQEIPYGCQVNVMEFKERTGKKDFVSVHIIVERDGHRGILLGKGGSAIKQLATAARMDIEEFLQRPVFLELSVKVVEGWRKDGATLKRYGYT